MLVCDYLSNKEVYNYFTTYVKKLPNHSKSNVDAADLLSDFYEISYNKKLKAANEKELNAICGAYLRNLNRWSIIDYGRGNKYKLDAPNTNEWDFERLEVFDEPDESESIIAAEKELVYDISKNLKSNYDDVTYYIYEQFYLKGNKMEEIVEMTGLSLGTIHYYLNDIKENIEAIKIHLNNK